jgi:hypothetical protein
LLALGFGFAASVASGSECGRLLGNRHGIETSPGNTLLVFSGRLEHIRSSGGSGRTIGGGDATCFRQVEALLDSQKRQPGVA